MARVRKAQTDATGADLPAELVRFVFADWHDPALPVAVPDGRLQSGTKVDPETDRAVAVVSAARARWRAAHREWAEVHGVDWRHLPPAVGPVVDRP